MKNEMGLKGKPPQFRESNMLFLMPGKVHGTKETATMKDVLPDDLMTLLLNPNCSLSQMTMMLETLLSMSHPRLKAALKHM